MKYFLLAVVFIYTIHLNVNCATYTVTNTNDSGAGSLRQAINDANGIGADVIEFNIPNTDPNYDAVNGVWVIRPVSALPYFLTGNTVLDGSTQTINHGDTNPYGPEIFIDGTNTITQCFIVPSTNNQIKGLVIGNFTYGVQFYGSASSQNTLSDCYIGAGYNGNMPFSNDVGITISNDSHSNTIINNLISGNITAGIAIQNGSNNNIYSNLIGTNYLGTDTLPNATGILIDNSTNNKIGSNSYNNRNIISGNTDSGITINGNTFSVNSIKGNFIGTDITGLQKLSNPFGIILSGSGNNIIGGITDPERNILSGNIESGILINGTGAESNEIVGNYIGVDSTGLNILDNHVGILIKTNADKNIIGGVVAGAGNVISGNWEIGVYIESCDSNIVIGNYIGPDATGLNPLKINDTLYQANGIELNTVARHNFIGGTSTEERNIISGNRVYGMIFYGQTSENYLTGNYIGTDVSGNVAMPNATGICVDAASNHNYIYNNLLSGNISYGIFIVTTGSYYNEVKGNYIGTNAAGTDTVPNDVGLLLSGGARYNVIGGSSLSEANIISGNHYEGIEIADNTTDSNRVSYNFIGTDPTGTLAVPNGNGIGFSGYPKYNEITSNIISGNSNSGMILYEFADSNIITDNMIGTAIDGTSDLGNGLSGIVIGTGASHNFIGYPGSGNTIAFNGNGGIVILDSISIANKISGNSVFQNEILGGIELFPPGVNSNDPGDIDSGPNKKMNFPEIISSIYGSITGWTSIAGTLDTEQPENCTVEIFIADPDPSGYGEGKTYVGMAIPDNSGNWSCYYSGIAASDEITATATDADGNTSEFSLNISTIVSVNDAQNDDFQVKIYPNPSDKIINISGKNIRSVYISDLSGKILYKSLNLNCDYYNLDTSYLSAGFYQLSIKTDNSVINKNIIIE